MYVVVQHANKIELMYRSTAKTGKHTDPVWQVRSYLGYYIDHCQQNLTLSLCALFLLRFQLADFSWKRVNLWLITTPITILIKTFVFHVR